jgi:subtilisin family serine protease
MWYDMRRRGQVWPPTAGLRWTGGAVLAAAVVVWTTSAARLPAQGRSAGGDGTEIFRGRRVAAGEVIVGFRHNADRAGLRIEADAEDEEPLGAGRLIRLRSRSRSVSSLIAALSARSDIAYVEPNYIVYATREPDDPRFPELWGLQNLGQVIGGVAGTPGADIGAAHAWDKAIGARTNVIGVVDTGVDYVHPDLAANIWAAPSAYTVTVGGRTITCAAGTHGFNAIAKNCDPFDDHGHGSHVAGTIGAVGSNGTGVAGINWYANIIGLKFIGPNGSGSLADAINAIEFAIQAKAAFAQSGAANIRVLSNSWSGGGFSQAMFDEITRTNQNDMLFVAAAGNSSSDNDAAPAYPASYAVPNIIAVSATNNQDALASFSNYGATSVHLGAPGVQVLSTLPGGVYGYFNGTSMATPHVSGSAALLLSRCTLTTAALKSLILNTVDPVPALSGITITGGRIDVGRAIDGCGPAGNQAPSIVLTGPSNGTVMTSDGSVILAATASDSDGGVARVAFYAGTALIGVDSTAPYQLSWTNPLVGNYSLTAVATDAAGAAATSNAAVVRVIPGSGSTPFGGSSAFVPGIIEAENFNDGGDGLGYHDLTAGNSGGAYRQTDVDIQTASDTGGGYTLGYVEAGEWMAYRISIISSATYTVDARVASQGVGGSFHLEVDGFDVSGPIAVPNTGGWQTWQTVSVPGVALTGGSHLLRVVIDTKGPSGWLGNLNYLRFSAPGVDAPPSVQLTAPANGTSYTAPATVALAANAADSDGTITQVAFYDGATRLGVDSSAPYSFTWMNVPAGTHQLTAVAADNAGVTATSNSVAIQVIEPPASTPFGGSPVVIPGTIEAENFDDGGEGVAYHDGTAVNSGGKYRQTGVDIEATLDGGGGFSLGYVAAGEWLKYTVSVTTSGSYTLESRVASNGSGGTFHVEIDAVDVTGPLAVPSTGGWQTWRSLLLANIPLTAGTHVIRLVFDSNGTTGWIGNINYLRWSPSAPGNAPPTVQVTAPSDGASFTPPASLTVSAAAADADGVAQVAFFAGATLLAVDTAAPYSVPWNLVPAGDYALTARALDGAGQTTTSATVLVHVVAATSPTPFGGARANVPGTIEAENFDDGGEGVAYHDTTGGNSGGQYRQTDVDIQPTTDTGGGYSIGYVTASEWLAYSIAVNTAGTYMLQARVASFSGGGSFHVEVDGIDVTGSLAIPNTGGWQTWQTVTRSGVSLTAGPHLMRVVFDVAGSLGFVGNVNYVRWSQE